MVKIRLARVGSKKRPCYHVVVMDVRKRRDGRYLERVGYVNMQAEKSDRVHLQEERIAHWVGNGAQVSDCVARLRKSSVRAASPAQ